MADSEVQTTLTREVYRVVSNNTGAVVRDELESERAAELEAGMLNAEAKRDGIMHLGDAQSYRAIGPVEVIDERAEGERAVEVLTSAIRGAKGEARERMQRELAERRARLDELKRDEEGE